jgi:gluconate transporter
MPIVIVACGILLLLLLIIRKVSPFLALLVVSILVGITSGMPLNRIVASLQTGIGDTLGEIALIIALGAMFGKLIEESGAARRISQSLIKKFGKQNVQWAVVLTGLIVGIPMFYNAGFIILLPLVFAIAAETGLSLISISIPMAASLSVTHGFLPPHPGPTALAAIFRANIGLTLLYGMIIAIPTVVVAGPLFSKFLRKTKAAPPQGLFDSTKIDDRDLPGNTKSLLLALLPVILIAGSAVLNLWFEKKTQVMVIAAFVGDPTVALLLSVILAVYVLHIQRGKKIQDVMNSLGSSIGSVALIMLIIAAGGAFKQIIIDAGVGSYISTVSQEFHFSPLVMGWAVAALMRVSLGSATVAGLTAASIVAPVIQVSNASPELMVLSLGAGSLMFSHVNDTGFWMFKEFFSLSMKQTFLSWSIMETIVSLMGLVGVLVLNILIRR